MTKILELLTAISIIVGAVTYTLTKINSGNLYNIEQVMSLNSAYANQTITLQSDINTKLISIENRLTKLESTNPKE